MKCELTNRTNVSIFEPLECRQMMSAGDLDPSFGTAGKVLASETVGFSVADMAGSPTARWLSRELATTILPWLGSTRTGRSTPAFGGINLLTESFRPTLAAIA